MVTSKKPAVKTAHPSARKDGLTKVRWSRAEEDVLALGAAQIIAKDSKISPFRALMKAQDTLPESVLPLHRRRPALNTISGMPWYPVKLAAALKRLNDEREAAAAPPAETKPAEPPQAVQASTPAPALNGHAVAPSEAVAAGVGRAMLNLRAMLVDELAAVFVEAMLKAMGSGLLGAPPMAEIAPADHTANGNGGQRIVFHPEPRKPTVLVAGLKGLQHVDIEKRFARLFNLRFVSADESKDKLRSEADRAEIAIVMKDHVANSQADIVKARTRNYIEQAGGVRQLQETLTGMLQ